MSVHPHAGGEHASRIVTMFRHTGSSPRGWGTPTATAGQSGSSRFIPTRVGNTTGPRRHATAPTVHPHAGGEHADECLVDVHAVGSSPRAWGTLLANLQTQQLRRFIPTRVGNTGRRHRGRDSRPVHPHAGGEHADPPAGAIDAVGSSPRGWGTLRHQVRTRCISRFIPTRVGNTRTWARSAPRHTVHPHAGGEHLKSRQIGATWYGSSPRGWGTHQLLVGVVLAVRFIPTRVGNTRYSAFIRSMVAVHPHAGGEHLSSGVDIK